MNLHTEFLTCHSCHIHIDEGEEIKFGWINPTEFTPEGEPYGTKLDPATGLLTETDDHYSKLTPFRKITGGWKPVIPKPAEEITLEPGLDPRYMDKLREIHVGTELEKFVKCSSCHSPDGIINFKELGFEPARVNQLERLEIGGMFSDYETFYFPDLFESKFK